MPRRRERPVQPRASALIDVGLDEGRPTHLRLPTLVNAAPRVKCSRSARLTRLTCALRLKKGEQALPSQPTFGDCDGHADGAAPPPSGAAFAAMPARWCSAVRRLSPATGR
jgi:hypothetical protein